MSGTLSGMQIGKYRLEDQLGEGGMAAVYRAIRQADGEAVAIKLMLPKLQISSTAVQRFQREARLMQSLDHPNILKVYDFGQHDTYTYLVMRLLDGGSLREFTRGKIMPVETVTRYLEQIASALDFAHERGIIHRDLKPANILMDKNQQVYLADFGIAKFKAESIALTATDAIIGTPEYMSPEQWRSEPLDGRTDVYAFGVMAYELFTGDLPFSADTPFSVMYRHLDSPRPNLSFRRPDIPKSADQVIHRAMAKIADRRYKTATDMVASLKIALADIPATPSRSTPPAPHRRTITPLDVPGVELEGKTFDTGSAPPARAKKADLEGKTFDTGSAPPARANKADLEGKTFDTGSMPPVPDQLEGKTFDTTGSRLGAKGIALDGKTAPTPIPVTPSSPRIDLDGHTSQSKPPTSPQAHTVTPVDAAQQEYEYDDINAVDTGARSLLQRVYEYIRESDGEEQKLAVAFSNYVQDLRENAKSAERHASPYKALESFDIADHHLFFGREAAIDGMLDRTPRGRFTVLHAESGSGKTSLIRAGLMPRLLAGGYLSLYVAVRRRAPHQAIKQILLPNPAEAPTLAKQSLRDYLQVLSKVVGNRRNIFIFIDQFETFFTDVFDDHARQEFISEVAECLDDALLPVQFTLAMRTEYFGLLSSFQPHIAHPFANELLLRPLTLQEAERALVNPAKARDYEYEYGLPQRILADLSSDTETIAPPQLQLVGAALIDALPDDSYSITNDEYQNAGQAQGVLRTYLERILERFPVSQRNLARLVIEGLVRSDQTRDVRTAEKLRDELAAITDSTADLQSVLNTLHENRILRLVELDDTTGYELVHDYLAQQIEIDPETAARKAAQELLNRRVADYEQYGSLLTQQEYEFIHAQINNLAISDSAETLIRQTRQAQQRQRRIALGLSAVAVIGIVLALGIGLFAVQRESNNRQERLELSMTSEAEIATQRDTARITESRMLADLSLQELPSDPVTSVNLALRALTPPERPYVPEAELALTQAIQTTYESAYLPAEDRLRGARWNQAQSQILTWGDDGVARLFAGQSGAPLLEIPHERPLVYAAWLGTDEAALLVVERGGIAAAYDAESGAQLYQLDTADIIGAGTDGALIVTWDADGRLSFWDAPTGAAISTQDAHVGGIEQIVWASDWVASIGADFAIKVWALPDGDLQATLTGHVNRVRGAVAYQDQLLSWGDDRQAIIWDATTGEPITTLSNHSDGVTNAQWHPDGQQVITTTFNGDATLWTIDGEEVWRVPANTVLDGALWHPTQDMILIYGEPNGTALINTQDGRLLAVLDAHSDTIMGAAWSPDGTQLLTFAQDGYGIIWDVATGSPQITLRGHQDVIFSGAWSDTLILTAGIDGTARLWDTTRTGLMVSRLPAAHGRAYAAQWDATESQIAIGFEDGTLGIWGDDTLQTFNPHTDAVRQVAWSATGVLASGGDDGQVFLLDGEPQLLYATDAEPITALSWFGDQLLITSEDSTAVIVDTRTGDILHTLRGHTAGIWSGLWNRAGSQILTSGADGSVRLWDAATGEALLRVDASNVPIIGARFNRDESLILTWGYDATAKVIDARTGDILLTLEGHTDWVIDAIWNPDETQLYTASGDRTIRQWDAQTGEASALWFGHTDSVLALGFSPDGQYLLSRSADGSAQIWDVQHGAQVQLLEGHAERVRVAAWNQTGDRILTAADDGQVIVWQFYADLGRLRDVAQSLLTRDLTVDQLQAFFLSP